MKLFEGTVHGLIARVCNEIKVHHIVEAHCLEHQNFAHNFVLQDTGRGRWEGYALEVVFGVKTKASAWLRATSSISSPLG